jgi:hypothetical protein
MKKPRCVPFVPLLVLLAAAAAPAQGGRMFQAK